MSLNMNLNETHPTDQLIECNAIKRELMVKYKSIIYDYLAIMNSSDAIKTMEFSKYAVQLGLSAITHIYKIAFYSTKHVDTTVTICQKGIYCFIEYIEQTCKLRFANQSLSPNSSPFDFADAVLFIYDKTLTDDNLTDCCDLNEDIQCKCKPILEELNKTMTTLIWFDNPNLNITEQIDVVDCHFIDFLECKLSENVDKNAFLFLEMVQSIMPEMEKTDYIDFLTAFKIKIKKRPKNYSEKLDMMTACLYLKMMNYSNIKEIIRLLG